MFWYPWGREALDRARAENKPILLSIGYSTCYWCHVMEREVFENLSIASQMNRSFINIKVDREEYPALDDIYMVARQLMTQEGGWPNNVFLTPDLKPFFAGGTYGPRDAYGKPAFPRLLEWLHYAWMTQEQEVREKAADITEMMKPHLVFEAPYDAAKADVPQMAAQLFALMQQHYDARAGGFFQAPKFPHECYLSFMLGYHEHSGNTEALEMVTRSLSAMATGGLYDHVGCGFHRYSVDKDWFVPHFEKMLYNQAQMARLYTDAARLTGNPYFADIARSVLEFVGGPMTDGEGAFYAAIDAETDGVEGAYYAWTAEELQKLLAPEEMAFFTHIYWMNEIPSFPGHKHPGGHVLSARRPLDAAAAEMKMPYVQLAAMAGKLMNTLLHARNQRPAPRLDNKIIVSWNGLMIDALAHGGRVFNRPGYIQRAKKAADFILERVIDNEGALKRIYAGGKAEIDATLEDYAMLIRGLLTLAQADSDAKWLESALSLTKQTNELFLDGPGRGYFFLQRSDNMLLRLKGGDDSAIPGANAIMLHNLVDLFKLTGDEDWRKQAEALRSYFLNGRPRVLIESATLMQAALRLEDMLHGKQPVESKAFAADQEAASAPDDVVAVSAALFPADARPGDQCELIVTLDIKEGWHINASRVSRRFLIPTQLDVQGNGVTLAGLVYPDPLRKADAGEDNALAVYEGMVHITARLKLARKGKARPKLTARLRFQPCREGLCHAPRDLAITI